MSTLINDNGSLLTYFIDCVGEPISTSIIENLKDIILSEDLVSNINIKRIDAKSLFEKEVDVEKFILNNNLSGIIISGSMSSVNDNELWINNLEKFIRDWLELNVNIPLLGVCFGHQIIAKAAGSKISKNQFLNDGINDIKRVRSSKILDNIDYNMSFYHYHEDIVDECPKEFELLLTNDIIRIMGICNVDKNIYTNQGHPEVNTSIAKMFNNKINDIGKDSHNFILNFFRIIENYWADKEKINTAFFKKNLPYLKHYISKLDIYKDYEYKKTVPVLKWFNSLPLLEKSKVMTNFPFNFLNSNSILESHEYEIIESSGTSEHKIQVIRPTNFKNEWSNIARKYHSVYDIKPIREALLTTLNCSRSQCNLLNAPYQSRINGERLILNRTPSPLLWNDDECRRMIGEIKLYEPTVLTVHPLYFLHLNLWIQKNNIDIPKVPIIFFSYDFISRKVLELAKKWVVNGVYVQYGLTEMFTTITQCHHGNYHVINEGLFAEVLRSKKTVSQGEVGELVVTSIRNPLMPLIRYRTGDLVRIKKNKFNCSCNNAVVIEEFEGRIRELTVTDDMRLITTRTLDDIVSSYEAIQYYQLHQNLHKEINIKVVADSKNTEYLELSNLKNELSKLYKKDISLEIVNEIPMNKNGKYSYVISEIDFNSLFDSKIPIK